MGRRSSHPTTAPRIGESANAATVRGDGSEDDRHRRPADQPERGPACIRVADDERRSAVDPRFHLADRRVRKGSRVADDRHTVAGTEDALAVPALGVVADGERAERPPHLRLVDCLHRVREPADALGWGLVGRDLDVLIDAEREVGGRRVDANADAVDDDAKRNPASPESIETHERPFPWLRYSDTSYAQQRHCSSENGAGSVSASSLSSSDLPCAPDAISARPVTRTRRSPACSDRGSVAVARATRSASREPRPPRARNPRLTSSAATPIRVGRIDRHPERSRVGSERRVEGHASIGFRTAEGRRVGCGRARSPLGDDVRSRYRSRSERPRDSSALSTASA